MRAKPRATYVVTDPKGIFKAGLQIAQGATFAAIPHGAHVKRWLAAGRISRAQNQPTKGGGGHTTLTK